MNNQNKKDLIATYYANAREFVKLNNPKAARQYVLAVLNFAVETYKKASTIMLKAKTAVFLDKWIAVSRELHEKGITDYVLECFNLPTNKAKQKPKNNKQAKEKQVEAPKTVEKNQPISKDNNDDAIDIAGLLDENSQEQGWCAKIFEENKTSIVEIRVEGIEKNTTGTGFIISENGYLLTNDHLVFDEENQNYYNNVKMSFINDKKSYRLNVIISDKKTDLALCSFEPDIVKEFTVVKLISNYDKVLQGADCLVIGNAFGMGLAPFTGVVRFTKNNNGDLVYTAPSNPGDSGGPVFNRQGQCIGINKSKTLTVNHVSADSYSNATPMDTILDKLDKWCSNNGIKL